MLSTPKEIKMIAVQMWVGDMKAGCLHNLQEVNW